MTSVFYAKSRRMKLPENALCIDCLSKANHMHHIVPYSMGGRACVPLCEGCHSKIHGINFSSHGALIRQGLSKARINGKRLGAKPKLSHERKVYLQQRIRLLRGERSQRELAKQFKLSQSMISRLNRETT